MKGSEPDEVRDEFASVANRLRAERADVSPWELDQIKQRVLSQSTSRYERRAHRKSRIAAIITVIGLMGGTGGAIAVASSSGSSSGPGSGAASGQYCPQMRYCGPGHHHHPPAPWWYSWWLEHHHQPPPWWWWYYYASHNHQYPASSWPGYNSPSKAAADYAQAR
jgi:hypothetical protein